MPAPDPWSDLSLVRTFDEVARDPASLRTFELGIGDAEAASRRAIASRLLSLGCGSVLDVGCGPGVFIDTLNRHAPTVSYLGIDESQVLVDRAIQRAGFAGNDARRELVCAIAGLGGFEQTDAVVLRHVLEHAGAVAWEGLLGWSLAHASKAAFVAVSQPMLQVKRDAVESDRFLGLRRWCLPFLRFVELLALWNWSIVETIEPPSREVVSREALYVLRPRA